MTQFQVKGFKELERALGASSASITKAFSNVSLTFAQTAEQVVVNTLVEAAASAGPEAFPPAYIAPMLGAARGIINITSNEIGIDFEAMGTQGDLIEGFHYGARIEGGDHVGLPYLGESLKNDVEERYIAWLRVYHGETWHGIDYSGTWTETIGARLDAWGDKAPQWLLLQYGQTEWEPTNDPFPIIENVTTELSILFEALLRNEVKTIVDRFNRGPGGG